MRLFMIGGAVLLAACASEPLVSTLPAEPPRIDFVGRGVPALSPQAAETVLGQFATALEGRLPGAVTRRTAGGLLHLRLATAELFEAGAAQLKPAALAPLSEVAASLLAAEGTVMHVLVYGETDATEPEAALGARRAASLLDYLVRRGVPATRLRAEGRSGTTGGERVELVLAPVVQGREAQAWVPPGDG